MTDQTSLLAAAARFKAAADILTDYTAGEFQQHTVEELWGLGFDAPEPTEAACAADGSWMAVRNPESNRIEFTDDSGELYTIDLATGELAQP